jgi:hypothetical protein
VGKTQADHQQGVRGCAGGSASSTKSDEARASVGNKRELIPDETCWPGHVSVPGREARRCHQLIRTTPALNNDTALSRLRMPEWLDERIGDKVEEQEEQEEIAAGV